MAYHFLNRRPKGYDLVFWESSKPILKDLKFGKSQDLADLGGWATIYGNPRATKSIGMGASLDFESGSPSLLMFVHGGDIVGPFHVQNGTHYILDDLDDPMTSVEGTWAEMSKQLGLAPTGWQPPQKSVGGQPQPEEIALSVVVGIAETLLSALATGLSAAGPQFAVGAGGAAGLGGLISMVMNQFEPSDSPLPPTLDELTNAISDRLQVLVREEADRNDARKATNVIDNTVAWFKNRLFNYSVDATAVPVGAPSDKPGRGLGRKRYDFSEPSASQFTDRLTASLSLVEQDTFASQLMFVAKNPKIGRFMLPSLLAGIGMWATLRRVELGHLYGSLRGKGQVPAWEIKDYHDLLVVLRNGLLDAMKSYIAYRKDLLGRVKMDPHPNEAMPLIKRMGEALLGDGLALPNPACKIYKSDADYATAEGAGWNFPLATGSAWLGETGYVTGDIHNNPVDPKPQLDVYGKALGHLNTTIAFVQLEADRAAKGEWPDRLLPIQAQV